MPQNATTPANPTNAADELLDAKRERAYSLHLRGRTYSAIGREIGIDRETAKRWCDAVARTTAPKRKQALAQARREAVSRMREIQAAAWALYELKDEAQALNTALAAEREIAKLRGLYEPEKVEHGGALTVRVEHSSDWRGMQRQRAGDREADNGD